MRGLDTKSTLFKISLVESQHVVAAILSSVDPTKPLPEMSRFLASVACSTYAAGMTNGIVLGLTQGAMAQDMINQELTGAEQAMAAEMAQEFVRNNRDEVPFAAGPRATSVPVGGDPAPDPAPGSADGVLEGEPVATSGYAQVGPLDSVDTSTVASDVPKPKRAARPRTRSTAGVATPDTAGPELPVKVS